MYLCEMIVTAFTKITWPQWNWSDQEPDWYSRSFVWCWLNVLQREHFDIYTVYCLKKTAAERCIDDLGGDQNPFLQVSASLISSL